jgi:beta-barrel assembly-enhancing protease
VTTRRWPCWALLGCLLSFGVQSAPPAAWVTERMHAMAERFDQSVRALEMVETDPALDRYLETVLLKLFPEKQVHWRVAVLKQSELNAFALPSGILYLNRGLIAHLENEAQLATIVAHEVAHVILEHSLQQRQHAEETQRWRTLFGYTGLPFIGEMVAAASLSGYSREHEREADKHAHRQLLAAGYDAHEAIKTFKLLEYYVNQAGLKSPLFFASHPRLQDRITVLKALNTAPAKGLVGENTFLRATQTIREQFLLDELARWNYVTVITLLERPGAELRWPKRHPYYLAEALRQRGNADDLPKALTAYQQAIAADVQHANAYLGMAKANMQQGNINGYNHALKQYLLKAQPGDPWLDLAKRNDFAY